jgi:hypothetical protein
MPITSLVLDNLLSSTDPAELSSRRALTGVSSAIAKARKVVVVSGAGISCSSGIPVGGLFSFTLFCRAQTGEDYASSDQSCMLVLVPSTKDVII